MRSSSDLAFAMLTPYGRPCPGAAATVAGVQSINPILPLTHARRIHGSRYLASNERGHSSADERHEDGLRLGRQVQPEADRQGEQRLGDAEDGRDLALARDPDRDDQRGDRGGAGVQVGLLVGGELEDERGGEAHAGGEQREPERRVAAEVELHGLLLSEEEVRKKGWCG